MGSIVLKGGCVLSLDSAVGDFERADVWIEGERIRAIQPTVEVPGAEVIDASNTLVLPGFVDTHRHLWEGILRNILPDGTLEDYFRDIMGVLGPVYRPEDVYVGTLVSALGALNAGVTTVLDWAHIQNSPEHTDASLQALRDSGMRAVFAYGAPSRQALNPHYPEDLRRISAQSFASKDQLLTLAWAGMSPEQGALEDTARTWRFAREVGARISVHAGFPGIPPGRFAEAARTGVLGPDVTYIHCGMFSSEEWKAIADTGGTVSLSAPVELQMGHGMPPIQASLDAGIRPSLSVDVETSVPGDFFTQMRSVFSLQRGLAHARGHAGGPVPRLLTAREVLEFATVEGARANGLSHQVGTLTPGKQADIILLRTDLINVMPVNSAEGAAVLGMDTSNVDTVLVAGKVRKRGGQLVGVDLPALRERVYRSRDFVRTRSGYRVPFGGGGGKTVQP
jgi:5-methylthioadenosine/S-adenosylhomocysteine deaminase